MPDQRLDFTADGHNEPEVWSPRLQRLLKDQLALASRLSTMGVERAGLLESGDIAAYAAKLDEREPVIREMSILAEEIRPFVDRFGTLAASLRTDERESIRRQVSRLGDAMASIDEQDHAEEMLLVIKRDALAKELASVELGRDALAAYDPLGGPSDATLHDAEG